MTVRAVSTQGPLKGLMVLSSAENGDRWASVGMTRAIEMASGAGAVCRAGVTRVVGAVGVAGVAGYGSPPGAGLSGTGVGVDASTCGAQR